MDDLLRQFENLLSNTGHGLTGSINLLLSQLEPEQAEQLKLCAIPHQFNQQILQVLLPHLKKEELEFIFTEFAKLSLVIVHSDGLELALHDEARQYLFSQWLSSSQEGPFQQANTQLVSFYNREISLTNNVEAEALEFNRMFHLIGANQTEGFSEFNRLFHKHLYQFRHNDCAALIKLVHEYDKILYSTHKLWLIYYEGRLSVALRNWQQALDYFNLLLSREFIPPILHVKANQRIGLIYVEQREWKQALKIFKEVLKFSESSDELYSIVDDIIHDLGTVYSHIGNIDEAEYCFYKSIKLAEQQKDNKILACSYDSLGKLNQKIGNSYMAVKFYEQSLFYLKENGDHFGPAGVYNNLGTAYADLGDWEKSNEALQRCLEIKTKAGDIRGQAKAYNNLARTFQNMGMLPKAIEVSIRSVQLFKQVKDDYHAGLVNYNIAKMYSNIKDDINYRHFLDEAIELFEKDGKYEKVKIIKKEFKNSFNKPETIPWWMWLIIILFILFMILVFLSILLE